MFYVSEGKRGTLFILTRGARALLCLCVWCGVIVVVVCFTYRRSHFSCTWLETDKYATWSLW